MPIIDTFLSTKMFLHHQERTFPLVARRGQAERVSESESERVRVSERERERDKRRKSFINFSVR